MGILSMHTFCIIFHVHQLHFFYFIRLHYFRLKNYDFLTDANGRGQIWHRAIEHFGLSQYLMQTIFIYFLHLHYITLYYYMCMYQQFMFQSIPSFSWLLEVLAVMFYLYQEKFEGTKGVIQRCNNDHVIKSIFTKDVTMTM